MKLKEIKERLEASGYPVAYSAFSTKSPPPMPFICYKQTGTDNFIADGEVYYRVRRMAASLYTREKDPIAEAALELALAGIPWQKYEEYAEDEGVFAVTYEFEI